MRRSAALFAGSIAMGMAVSCGGSVDGSSAGGPPGEKDGGKLADGASSVADAGDARAHDSSLDTAREGEVAPPGDSGDASAEGGRDETADGAGDGSDTGATVDGGCAACDHLPNVKPGTPVSCVSGHCVIPPGSCVAGFAHCSSRPEDGCETDLSLPSHCGNCTARCAASCIESAAFEGGHTCGTDCDPAHPERCNGTCCSGQCVDTNGDDGNCGKCGTVCTAPNWQSHCQDGQCSSPMCDDGWADCTALPGCETPLDMDKNCGGCGIKACVFKHTTPACGVRNGCASPLCEEGFGNCDTTIADCETAVGAPTGCLPKNPSTDALLTDVSGQKEYVALAPDGSYFIAGLFTGSVDFDPGAGTDVRSPRRRDSVALFVTKRNSDGSYAWTRVLDADSTDAGNASIDVSALAVDAQGSLFATGTYQGAIDFDPGAAVDRHSTLSSGEPYVLKLKSDGSFAWARTFAAQTRDTYCSGAAVAGSASGSVIVAGSGYCKIDLDPGAGSMAAPDTTERFLVALDASGNYVWGHAYTGEDCQGAIDDLTVAPDGSAWGAGVINGDNRGMAICIQSVGLDGAPRGTWQIGPAGIGADEGPHIAAAADGSIYVGGQYNATVDFDPGPGVANQSAVSSGFLLKLGPDGSFRWVQTLPDRASGVASTKDGGVAAVVGGNLLMKLYGDDTPAWTLATPAFAREIRVGAGAILVAGPAGNGGVSVWRYGD